MAVLLVQSAGVHLLVEALGPLPLRTNAGKGFAKCSNYPNLNCTPL